MKRLPRPPRVVRLAALLLLGLVLGCRSSAPPPAPAPERIQRVATTNPRPAPAPPPRTVPVEPLATPSLPEPPTEAAAADPRLDPPIVELVTPGLVRVGLATDLERYAPSSRCCARDSRLVAEDGSVIGLVAGTVVEPSSAAAGLGSMRLQVAALKGEEEARRLSGRLATALAQPADAVFDADSDLYKVRVGRYRDREQADAAKVDLAQLGFPGAWIVHEDRGLAGAGLVVRQGDKSWRVSGRTLALEGPSPILEHDGVRYRGRLLLFLNQRGLLNLVNELAFEDYLRGVVPKEMGPAQYPLIEALKAQTVAARTYALRNFGEFSNEGYDLCATPRCQVYGGVSAEHPLTDRAIAETRDEILVHRGELIESLYSATCGGHTERVSVVFPQKRAAYLAGVPCVEGGVRSVDGRRSELGWSTVLLDRVAPIEANETVSMVSLRLAALGKALGVRLPRIPSSGRGSELTAFARSLATAVPGSSNELAWTINDLALEEAGERELSRAEQERFVVGVAAALDLLEWRRGLVTSIEDEMVGLHWHGRRSAHWVSPNTALYVGPAGAERAANRLYLAAGDPVSAFLIEGRLISLVLDLPTSDGRPPRRGQRADWSHFRSEQRLRKRVAERFPGFELAELEVGRRGVSGRVATLELIGDHDEREVVEGLDVRWTLDLPDTWFEVERFAPPSGERGWLFRGHGWGHGVGMCQVGAVSMAERGAGYRDILRHYYSGAEVIRLEAGE